MSRCRPRNKPYTLREAKKARAKVKLPRGVTTEDLLVGMNVELEHYDLTCGDLTETARIAAAHLRENERYYSLLKSLGL